MTGGLTARGRATRGITGQLPNSLSIARVVIALCLIPAFNAGWELFLGLYLTCGLTDVLDGWVARRLGVTSLWGARLDSVGDAVLSVVALVMLTGFTQVFSQPAVWVSVLAVAAVKIAAIIVLRARHGVLAIVHTWGNKLAGLVCFAVVPLALQRGELSTMVVIAVGRLCLLAAVDEVISALRWDDLDLDRRGSWHPSRCSPRVPRASSP